MTERQDTHHDGLEHRELRRLIAEAERNNETSSALFASDVAREEVYYAHLVKMREKAIKDVRDYEIGRGLRHVVKQMGWRIYDISCEIGYDAATYLSFVGTREELLTKVPDYEGEE